MPDHFIAAAHLILRALTKDRFGFERSGGAASIPVCLLDIQIIQIISEVIGEIIISTNNVQTVVMAAVVQL